MTLATQSDINKNMQPKGSVTSQKDRQILAEKLTGTVADSYMLLTKTQAYHWNVTGPLFVPIHELTEKQYRDLFEAADDLAERIRALGEFSPTSYEEFSRKTVIDEDDGKPKPAQEMVEILATDNEKLARRMMEASDIAEEIGDKVTEDMLIARMKMHEQNAWMLRATASDEGVSSKTTTH